MNLSALLSLREKGIDLNKVVRFDITLLLCLLIGAMIFFMPLLGGGFVADDFTILRFVTYGDPAHADTDPKDSTAVLRYFFEPTNQETHVYRPLVLLSFRLSYQQFGTSSSGFLMTNLLIHLLNAVIVARLLRFLPPNSRAIWLAAIAVFLFHPLQVQVVTWSAARSDSLSFFFGSLALLLKFSHPKRALLPALLILLALLCKESAIVWAAALIFFEIPTRTGDKTDRSWDIGARGRRLLPLASVVSIYFILRSQALNSLDTPALYNGLELSEHLSQKSLKGIGKSLLFIFCPVVHEVIPNSAVNALIHLTQLIANITLFLIGGRELMRRGLREALLWSVLLFSALLSLIVGNPCPDFLLSRAFYTSMLLVACLITLAYGAKPRTTMFLSLALIATFLPSSIVIRDCWVRNGAEVKGYQESLDNILDDLPTTNVNRIVVLNPIGPVSSRGGFVLGQPPPTAFMRPFMKMDLSFVSLGRQGSDKTYPAREFAAAFPRSGEKSIVVRLRLDREKNANFFELVHADTIVGKEQWKVEPVEPGWNQVTVINIDHAELETFEFTVRHQEEEGLRFVVAILDGSGLLFELPGIVGEIRVDGDTQTTSLQVPPIPKKYFEGIPPAISLGWSVEVSRKDGTIIGRSPTSPIQVRFVTEESKAKANSAK